MKSKVGYMCMAFAVAFAACAVVSISYGIPLMGGALLFGFIGVGLLAPSEPGPNPRTAHREGDAEPDEVREVWVGWDG